MPKRKKSGNLSYAPRIHTSDYIYMNEFPICVFIHTHTHTHTHTHIYIYIYLYIYIYKYICIHEENTYAHTSSHKYAYTIFMISRSNEQLQQQLEDTLLKPDCHSW